MSLRARLGPPCTRTTMVCTPVWASSGRGSFSMWALSSVLMSFQPGPRKTQVVPSRQP
ncbi:MAG: hypothetical protein V1797_10755 [Pseudomonadota bacterium]